MFRRGKHRQISKSTTRTTSKGDCAPTGSTRLGGIEELARRVKRH